MHAPTVTIRPCDLSQYEVFTVSAAAGNSVTIAVKSTEHVACRIDGHPRWSIHLMLWGDFGPWEHYWSHCGQSDEGWWNWLESTDADYWLKKMVGGSYQEFDSQRSLAAAHKTIEEYRADLELDIPTDENGKHYAELRTAFRDALRDAHDELRDAEGCDQGTFYHVTESLTFPTFVYAMSGLGIDKNRDKLWAYNRIDHHFSQGDGFSVYTRTNPRLVWFWDNVWRPFITEAKANGGFRTKAVA